MYSTIEIIWRGLGTITFELVAKMDDREVGRPMPTNFNDLKGSIESSDYFLGKQGYLDAIVKFLNSGRNFGFTSCDILLFLLQCITRGPTNVNVYAISMNLGLVELLLDFASKTILSASETDSAAMALRILTFLPLNLSGDDYYKTVGMNMIKLKASEPNVSVQEFSEAIQLAAESSRRHYTRVLSSIFPLILSLLSQPTVSIFKATLGLTLMHNILENPSNLGALSKYYEDTYDPNLTFVPQIDSSTNLSLPPLQIPHSQPQTGSSDSLTKFTNIGVPLFYWILRAACGTKPLPLHSLFPDPPDTSSDSRKSGTAPSLGMRYDSSSVKPVGTGYTRHWSVLDEFPDALNIKQREERQWLRTVALNVLTQHLTKTTVLMPHATRDEIAHRTNSHQVQLLPVSKRYIQFVPVLMESQFPEVMGKSSSGTWKQKAGAHSGQETALVRTIVEARTVAPHFRKQEVDLSFFQFPSLVHPLIASPSTLSTILHALHDLPHSNALVQCVYALREFLFLAPHITFPLLFPLLPDVVVCASKHPSVLIPELAIYFPAFEAYKYAPGSSTDVLRELSICIANIQRKIAV